ncbi:Glycosyl transferases group 1 [Candidatus Pelagibacterales bacterium]
MIKILKMSTYYDNYLNWFYNNNLYLEKLDYSDHHSILMKDRYGWSDSFKINLEKENYFKVDEVIFNDLILQKKWSREFINKSFIKKNIKKDYEEEILQAQIAFYDPDIIFFHNSNILKKYYKMIKSFNKKIATYDGTANNDKFVAKQSDLVITCLDKSREFYRSENCNAIYMPHGFDSRLLDFSSANKDIEFSFIGGIWNLGHTKRIDILDHLLKELQISLWIGDIPSFRNSERSLKSYLKKIRFLPYQKKINNLKKIDLGPLYGANMYKCLGRSLITFNSHINQSKEEAANMRLFESTGLGACLVTDWKNNISNFFLPDEEIVVYKSKDEAIEKIKYLLNHKEKVKEIALKGQKKTLLQHTLSSRWTDVKHELKKLL